MLYARLLGSSWHQLAEPVRSIHCAHATVVAAGPLRIVHGRSRIVGLLTRLLRLPRAHPAAPTRLVIAPREDEEQWRRTFDGRRLETRQYEAGEGELAERIGVLEFRFRLEVSEGGLRYRQTDAAFPIGSVRLRLPPAWMPRVDAREDPAGAHRVRVHVSVEVPALGPVLTYDGTVEIEGAPA